MTITTIISLMLLIYVQRHRPITLDFGGWTAPFGIQFLGDSLSLIMVTTASFVITLWHMDLGVANIKQIVIIYLHLYYF